MLYLDQSTLLDHPNRMLFGMTTKGERLKEAREAAKLTQPQLARLVGVTKASVSHWETGRTKDIKNNTFARISDVTGYTVRWLATGEGPKTEKGGTGISAASLDFLRKYESLSSDDRAAIQIMLERLTQQRA